MPSRPMERPAFSSPKALAAHAGRVGTAIKTHRLRRGLTQAQLAEQAGVSREHIGNLESAKISLDKIRNYAGLILELAAILDVGASDLDPIRFPPEADGSSTPTDGVDRLQGQVVFNRAAFEAGMAAESFEELCALFPLDPSESGLLNQVSLQVTPDVEVLTPLKARVLQDQLDRHMRRLAQLHLVQSAQDAGLPEGPEGMTVAFNEALAEKVESALESGDTDALEALLHSPVYFLDLIQWTPLGEWTSTEAEEAIERAFSLMRRVEIAFPGPVLRWRRRHDVMP